MNTKTLSNRALSVIDQYSHLQIGSSVSTVPYFNNKTIRSRAALRTYTGKGSPKDIHDEVESLLSKNHVALEQFSDEALKKLMTDQNIGIDCSGFAYYILNAENEERGKGSIDKHISFVNCTGFIGKIRCSLRPAENCDVATFVHVKNSHVIDLKSTLPGDIITMTGDQDDSERDHILVIHQVDYQNFVPFKIYYSHAVSYPEDGLYGSGIKQGFIEIADIGKSILDAIWNENGIIGGANRLFVRAQKSQTELRRLNWFRA